MNLPISLSAPAENVEAIFAERKVRMTLGGEPTLIPINPDGPEWSVTAVGPTKLNYAYAFSDRVIADVLPGAAIFYSPGKSYPGEVNPRWVLNVISRKDGKPLIDLPFSSEPIAAAVVDQFRRRIGKKLGVSGTWIKGISTEAQSSVVWILPLDHDDTDWQSASWKRKTMRLIEVEGAAGLRLPLGEVPEGISRRALTIEWKNGAMSIFFPPLMQGPFLELLEIVNGIMTQTGAANVRLQGYVPSDEGGIWAKLGVASDPGVLEINIPPCQDWAEYARWMHTVERTGTKTGLRSIKIVNGVEFGTGGGNHLCFGGPSTDENPFFTRPGWLTSILRFWQHHPSLSYLFTGMYVGSSSQAPRTDESARDLYDLEMAYHYLESLPAGDHRQIINETLRHLHIDGSGNTHRSEVSFDKFWNTSWPGGALGIVEFRAVETLPGAEAMSSVALLWRALAAVLLANPYRRPLKAFGTDLHNRYFLPSFLWNDLESVLAFLEKHGIDLPSKIFYSIWDWRLPVMLETAVGGATVTIRKALESWPLLCETPLEGGSTSRFVDTSIERIEITADAPIEARFQGRKLPLVEFPSQKFGAGLRFRKSALYPSLHPGIPPQLPLDVDLTHKGESRIFQLQPDQNSFSGPFETKLHEPRPDCRRSSESSVTYDLRLP